ncbi:putative quinate permease [Colletotrichum gloeosporioides]|uniref:Putative quinate permease n=1 Tax=Colletotrichum gloeosporioides TaxID=474922 RepID=A0A8H4CVP2_COLGL|nr:putative quinate permease [Colletotrichum gloeosporioides]KAF3810941.1 putative quinate permease [Colletotrichum gloeosporioides]
MVAMLHLAGYSALSGSFEGTASADAGARTALAMIYIYVIFYGFSWNGIPWIFASEALPNRARTLGMMIAVCAQWLAQFIVVYSLPHTINKITWGTFLLFGTCTVVAFVFAFLFVPETKGVPLEDMDMLLGADAPLFARATRRRYLEARDAGLINLALHLSQEKQQVERENVEGERV